MWLVGMMGSGKSTVGEAAAARIGVRFFDTDRMVVELAHMSLPEIWDGVGEEGFRRLERKAVAAVPDSGCVAAAGGGAVLSEESRDHMRKGAPVVWLRCRPETLAERVDGLGGRPLLDGVGPVADRLSQILAGRARLYEEVATDIVDTDARDIDDVVSEVVEIWGN